MKELGGCGMSAWAECGKPRLAKQQGSCYRTAAWKRGQSKYVPQV